MMIREQHYDSRRIRHEVDQVQKKWSAFFMSIGNYRQSLDASTKFFEFTETVCFFFSGLIFMQNHYFSGVFQWATTSTI